MLDCIHPGVQGGIQVAHVQHVRADGQTQAVGLIGDGLQDFCGKHRQRFVAAAVIQRNLDEVRAAGRQLLHRLAGLFGRANPQSRAVVGVGGVAARRAEERPGEIGARGGQALLRVLVLAQLHSACAGVAHAGHAGFEELAADFRLGGVVHVAVDQPGQDRAAARVHDPGIRRDAGLRGRPGGFDAIAAQDDHAVCNQLAAIPQRAVDDRQRCGGGLHRGRLAGAQQQYQQHSQQQGFSPVRHRCVC